MKISAPSLRSPLIAGLLISIFVFLGIIGIRRTGGVESLELSSYDWVIRLHARGSEPDSRIVLVTINEEDIRTLGRWPLSDATVARLLTELIRHQPRAVGVDLYRDIPMPPGHEEFRAVLTTYNNIVMVMKFGEGTSGGISPPEVLEGTHQVGFNDFVVDPGGIVRRGLLFLDDGETVFFSFPLRLALLYLHAEGITPQPSSDDPSHIRLGKITVRPFQSNDGGYVGADASGYQFLIDYRGGHKKFASYSLTDVLSGVIDPESIKDKIILIGATAESVPDFFYTPFSRGFRQNQYVPGVSLHAHIVSQLLHFGIEGTAPIAFMSEINEALWLFLWCAAGGITGIKIRSLWRFVLVTASGLLVIGLFTFFSFQTGWWIPSVPPALGWLTSVSIVTAYMSNQEKRERALLMHLFSRHVSPEVAETIWQERDQFLDGGRPRPQRLTATVLFSDLVGFTSVSEKLSPPALMDWLNQYMEAMAQEVIAHGGVVDKYIGDAIMAVFGVPIARRDEAKISQDAVNAVNCALAMERKIIQLNNHWQIEGLPVIGVRVGIFTGPLIAGSIGSAQRLEYSVIGDTVNIASRLESFDKNGFGSDLINNPCRILLGESTVRHLNHHFATQKVGEVNLKGKEQSITVYRVAGKTEDQR